MVKFIPDVGFNERLSSNSGVSQFSGDSLVEFSNEWIDMFAKPTQSPQADSKPILKKYIRRVYKHSDYSQIQLVYSNMSLNSSC